MYKIIEWHTRRGKRLYSVYLNGKLIIITGQKYVAESYK